jgi:hypothetical protein
MTPPATDLVKMRAEWLEIIGLVIPPSALGRPPLRIVFQCRTFWQVYPITLWVVTKRSRGKNIVGRRVAEARNSSQSPLTQDALSGKLARIGVQLDRAAIAKIEGNRRCVFDYELKALSRVLRVEVDWLLGGEQ